LSGVINSAALAGEEPTAAPVTILDARQLSLGTGYVAWRAALEAEKGLSADEIVGSVSNLIPRIRVFAVLDTLEYLQRSGRMSGFQAGMGSLLSIKPLLIMNDGEPTSERIRRKRKALARMIALVEELGPLERLDLLHTNAPREIDALRAQAAPLFPPDVEPLTVDVTPVLGAHLGPGVVGFAAIQARPT
jgi:DegV family protein with EDD domain